MFSAPTCTASAPAIIISTTSSALATPPQPIIGIRHALRTWYTILRAIGNMALPEKPPMPAAITGRRRRMSILIPRKVLTSVRPSAPASSHALAMATMSVTFGLSLMNTGFEGHAFLAAAATLAAESGSVPNAIPPLWTFGQEMLTSTMSIPSHSPAMRQQREYSSMLNPLMFAMTVLWKTLRSRGTLSATRASIPGF